MIKYNLEPYSVSTEMFIFKYAAKSANAVDIDGKQLQAHTFLT